MEGQGDLVSGLIMGITRVTIWVVGIMNLLTKSPSPSKDCAAVKAFSSNYYIGETLSITIYT